MKFLQKTKKSLGQNFLIDNNIINKIIEIGNINNNKTVLVLLIFPILTILFIILLSIKKFCPKLFLALCKNFIY